MSVVRALFGAALFASIACDSDSSPASPGDVVGTYRLESVSGKPVPTEGLGAVLAGEIRLGADSHMTRRMRYQLSGVAPERELVSEGTFTVRHDTVALAFVEDPAHPERITRNSAVLAGSALTLRWANPADGPDIVEVFRRQP